MKVAWLKKSILFSLLLYPTLLCPTLLYPTLAAGQEDDVLALPELAHVIPDRPFRVTPFNFAQFTSDGARIVVASFNSPGIQVLDSSTGEILKSIRVLEEGERGNFGGLALDSSDRFALIGIRQSVPLMRHACRIELWDLEEAECIQQYHFEGRVLFTEYAVCFWGDESKVAAVENNRLCIWDRDSGDLVSQHQLPMRNRGSSSFAFNPVERQLIVGERDRLTKILSWNTMGGSDREPEITSIELVDDGLKVQAIQEDRFVIANSDAPNFQILELGRVTHRVSLDDRLANSAALLTPDRRYLIGGGVADGRSGLYVWELASLELIASLELPRGWTSRSWSLDPSGDRLLINSFSGDLALLNVPDLTLISHSELPQDGPIADVKASHDTIHLISLSQFGVIQYWDSTSGMPTRRLVASTTGNLQESPHGSRLAITRNDGSVEVIDSDTAEALYSRQADRQVPTYLQSVAGFRDETTLVHFDSQFRLTIVDIESQSVSFDARLLPHETPETSVANLDRDVKDQTLGEMSVHACFSSDHEKLTIATNRSFAVYQVATGELDVHFEIEPYKLRDLVACPDGQSVICAWSVNEIIPGTREHARQNYFGRFDLSTGEWTYRRRALGTIDKIQLSPSGELFALSYSVGPQPYVVGETASGEILQHWGDTSYLLVDLQFLTNEDRLMSVDNLNQILIWNRVHDPEDSE